MLGVDESLPWVIGGLAGDCGPLRFTSCQECPSCHEWAIHWLDQPKIPSWDDKASYDMAVKEWMDDPGQTVVCWGGDIVRSVGGAPFPGVPPVDESKFEVMRVCIVCGHRWGNV